MIRSILRFTSLSIVALVSLAYTSLAQDTEDESATSRPPRRLPGMQREGNVLLPNQWSLRPTGKQIKLGDFPIQIALHPNQPWAAVLHAGYGTHEIATVDLQRQRVVARVSLPQTFYGICFESSGKRLFASGGEYEVIHQFAFADGYLSEHRELSVGKPSDTGVPAGLACSPDGKTLYAALAWGHALAMVDLAGGESSEGAKPRSVIALGKDSYPYAPLPTPDGKRLYVSLWGKAEVTVINLASLEIEKRWQTAAHPTEMALSPDGRRLFVACANSNTVSVIDTETGEPSETISSALYPKAPNGSTPNSLSLTPDGKVLFIANADNNNLAVFNVSESGKSRSMGFIPVGWYPTSVRFSPLDKQIYVANGKGMMSQANPQGPNPLNGPPATVQQYIGGLFRGTLSIVAGPSPDDMARYTETAYRASPLRADFSPPAEPEAGNPIPAKPGDASPIKYCIYVIKENRTYDQVFGDLPEGNGEADLCIFPEAVTPNHHALAREFVLLDNFYVESEVSADGHEWSMAAYATDFVEKSWPLVYRGGQKKLDYPSEGAFAIAVPAGGYIWDRCREADVSYRSYGEFITNGRKVGDPGTAAVPALEGHFDPQFRGYDLDYADVKRTARFVEELRGFEQRGDMPHFIVLRLPNDHTYGQRRGKPTPTAMVADNDLALGQLIEALSKSKFWKEMAVF
ncbi:MAG TPA: bifunctional YncE family protein/alkaline phosphatase family protein, partial [Pirellulales bacterium]